jgi:hypothetical protein
LLTGAATTYLIVHLGFSRRETTVYVIPTNHLRRCSIAATEGAGNWMERREKNRKQGTPEGLPPFEGRTEQLRDGEDRRVRSPAAPLYCMIA